MSNRRSTMDEPKGTDFLSDLDEDCRRKVPVVRAVP